MIAFGGMLLASAGFAMFFAFVFAAAETVGIVPPEVTHTLEVLAAQFFMPLVVGLLVALVASALGILRHRALPRWLGYFSILVAIVFGTATGLDSAIAIAVWILGGAAWIAVVSVMLFAALTLVVCLPVPSAPDPRWRPLSRVTPSGLLVGQQGLLARWLLHDRRCGPLRWFRRLLGGASDRSTSIPRWRLGSAAH
jgi:hypothetical protein